MSYFSWSEDLSVGSKFIDDDHRKLFDLANRLHIAMGEGRGKDVISKVLSNLIIYTREHFTREEDHMVKMAYPGYTVHKGEHEKLLKAVLDLQAKFNDGKTLMTIEVSNFLRDWLLNHIMKQDKELAKAMA